MIINFLDLNLNNQINLIIYLNFQFIFNYKYINHFIKNQIKYFLYVFHFFNLNFIFKFLFIKSNKNYQLFQIK